MKVNNKEWKNNNVRQIEMNMNKKKNIDNTGD